MSEDDNVVIVRELPPNVVVAGAGTQGPPGPAGPVGPVGPVGSLPSGGGPGQVLIETSPGVYVWGPINGGTP